MDLGPPYSRWEVAILIVGAAFVGGLVVWPFVAGQAFGRVSSALPDATAAPSSWWTIGIIVTIAGAVGTIIKAGASGVTSVLRELHATRTVVETGLDAATKAAVVMRAEQQATHLLVNSGTIVHARLLVMVTKKLVERPDASAEDRVVYEFAKEQLATAESTARSIEKTQRIDGGAKEAAALATERDASAARN